MKKSTKIIIGAVVVVALAAIVSVRMFKPKEVIDPVPPPTVQVMAPAMGNIYVETSLIGNVEPSDVVYVTPKMAGEVVDVFVKAGDVVKAGQKLLKIDTKQVDSAKLSLDSATMALADAQTNLQRMQVLYASGDISAQSFEQVETGVKQAQIQYDGAKLAYDTQLEYSTITAPIGGLIETFDASVHDTVSQQNMICVISGEGSKAVTFSVTERIMKNMAVGDAISIEKSGSEYQAQITEISSMIDAATGLFKVKASVEGGDALATGTAVKLYLTADKADDVMLLPIDNVYYDGGNAYVYTYDAGIVHKTSVEVGIYDDTNIHLISGLTLDSQVITTWSPELYEGAPALLGTDAQGETAAADTNAADPSTTTDTDAAVQE